MKKLAAVLLAAGVVTTGVLAAGTTVYAEAPEGEYTITYNLNEGNGENMPEYQFLSGTMNGILQNESRLYVQIDLKLDGKDAYELTSDCYVVENGKTAKVGDGTGIGQTMTTTAEGTYVDNGDNTVTISTPEHVLHKLETDTYSAQMKEACNVNVLGNTEDGEYDSEDTPELLSMVPETIFTLDEDGKIVSYEYAHPEEHEKAAEVETDSDASAQTGTELLAIPSDDEQTSFTLFDNGTYEFYFETYDVKDAGTYVYDPEAKTLTITDAKGKETKSTVDGDSIKFHYEYSESAQLLGDFTVEAAALEETLK